MSLHIIFCSFLLPYQFANTLGIVLILKVVVFYQLTHLLLNKKKIAATQLLCLIEPYNYNFQVIILTSCGDFLCFIFGVADTDVP